MDVAGQNLAARDPWWRRWLEPVVAVAIVTVLVMALVMLGVAGFQSLKGDISASEARQRQDLKELKADLKGDIADLKDDNAELKADLKGDIADLKDDNAELKADLKGDIADLRADNRALSDKLDQMLEILLAGKP